MERKEGFYWAKTEYSENWQVCLWSGVHWYDTSDNMYDDKDLVAINEDRILSPDEGITKEDVLFILSEMSQEPRDEDFKIATDRIFKKLHNGSIY